MMNGVQALALLGNHSKTNLKIESTSSNSSSSASSFTSILEQMVSGSNVNPSSIKGATEKEQELELQIDLASLNLSEMAMLEENEDILEMLALLPEEVQNDLFEFLKGDLSEASFIELAEGQQALLMLVHSILMPYQQTADKSKPTNMATFVQRNIGIDVNNFETMDDQLTELKMLLEQKKAAGDSFVDIFQKKDATNTIKLPVFQEQPMPMGTQG
ncbi:hypothetical protein JCM9157_3174 [Halalkalibacter akibai JCM 9157]|uniref:Uncharacterized protein n=2 Tax=Halalkalibacter akibai TaxID=1411 RepID=W4QXI8_HALA3|nr:hypothetical protein JCM9157_3174 [Halalkalibacter akibai JCM 9157]